MREPTGNVRRANRANRTDCSYDLFERELAAAVGVYLIVQLVVVSRGSWRGAWWSGHRVVFRYRACHLPTSRLD
eukprot:COSAG06_NODE_60688_length_270_cov_0.602339_1_plen_73_part_01